MNNKELYEAVVKLGIEIDHHESDLYLPVTPETTALVNTYVSTNSKKRLVDPRGYAVRLFAASDGKTWYDIPFAYIPFWLSWQEYERTVTFSVRAKLVSSRPITDENVAEFISECDYSFEWDGDGVEVVDTEIIGGE